MIAKRKVLLTQFFFIFYICFVKSQTPQNLKYTKVLDGEGRYVLRWDYNETHIEFETRVATTGYVGFGISRTGQMSPADIVIGWITDNRLYFGDYHTEAESRTPVMDASQDWEVRGGSEDNGTTTLYFSRRLDTCDDHDEPITGDTQYVIFSYHDTDPDTNTGLVPYHGPVNRASVPINLLYHDVVPPTFPPQNTFTMDFKNHMYPVPAVGSTVQCIVFNMSNTIPRSHIIKYEPIITAGNERVVYRMNLYRCNLTDPGLDGRILDCGVEAEAGAGPESQPLVSVKSCKSIVASWAMGGEAFHFPDDVGLSMGASHDPYTYVLEIHYTNFEYTEGMVDSSGLRVTYTTSPRLHEAGMLEVGSVISQGWRTFIPHDEPNFVTKTFCTPRCMNWGFDSDKTPMQAIGLLFKGNDAATSFKLRHFRGNEEQRWIAKDESFSNFHHMVRLFQQPVTIDSWDSLSLECTYNTSKRNTVTRGGWSRIEEMCRATLIYYPKKPFDMCLSWNTFDTLLDTSGQPVPEGEAMSYLGNVTSWTPSINQQLKDAFRTSSDRSLCSSVDRQPAYAVDRHSPSTNQRTYDESRSCPIGTGSRIVPRINLT